MLLEILKQIEDNRGKQGQKYELSNVLYISILALLSGAISYRKIHSFMKIKFSTLKELLNLSWKRVPAYTTIRDIIQSVDAQELERVFRIYSQELSPDNPGTFVACDGKVLRGSFDHMEDQKAVHLLSVFAAEENLILAHEEIDEKTNEIPVFQQMLTDLDLTGKIFTLDALHTQKKL